MAFRIGIPTILELNDLDATVSFCQDIGLNLIEIGMTRPNFLPSNLKADVLRKITEEKGIEFTVHLPEEFDLATFHEPIRTAFTDWIVESLSWCKTAGIQIITMHLSNGIYYSLPNRREWLYEVYMDKYLDNICRSFSHIEAKLDGQVFCIENCSNFFLSFIKEVIEHYSPFSLTWDVGHDAATGYEETKILKKHRDKIAHMHLHDCLGTKNHKELYTGDVDIDSMVAFAKENDISIILEVKTINGIKESIQSLRERRLIE